MAKEKRYVEIEIEVECAEEGMTDDGWQDYYRLGGLYEVMGDVVKSIGLPKITRRGAKRDA